MLKKFLKKIDEKFFNNFFIKIYKNLYGIKKVRIFNKNYIIKIEDLKQYKSLTSWNNFFNHIHENNIEGDIVECGVGGGQSLSYILFNLVYNKNHSNRKYIGFDSFEGFPIPSDYDHSYRNPKKGDWNHTSEEFVINNLIDLGFKNKDFNKIKFIKGFFEKKFQEEKKNITKISILHIDCDLYSSTKISLETWFDKVEKNGIIVFDEYLNSIDTFPGAVKAIDNFFGSYIDNLKICKYTKKYYLIKL